MKGSLRSRILKRCEERGVYVYFCDKVKGGYKLKVDVDFDEKCLEGVCKIIKVKKSYIGSYRCWSEIESRWETKSVFVEEL